MTHRRYFLRSLLSSLFGTSLLSTSRPPAEPLAFTTDEGQPSWSTIRKQFPLDEERVYLNNGTFGPAPYPVLRAVEDKLSETSRTGEYGNTDTARSALAAFLGVTPEELSLTHNTTEGINIVCWGLPLQRGDEVILTEQEHVGNALPWLLRARLHGIVLRTFSPAPTAEETLERIQRLAGRRTRVLALPHVTCTTGQVLPIGEISAWASEKGIFTAIDGAHGAGTCDLDLRGLGCDTYATCGHKWLLGPSGTGMLYIRRPVLDRIQAYHVGAYSDTDWQLHGGQAKLAELVPTAHRYDYGSQSAPLYEGAAAAVTFHEQIGPKHIEARLRELNEQLYRGLAGMGDRLELLTPAEARSRISMITFRPKSLNFRQFNKLAARAGYRLRIIPESDLDAIRVSTHFYNSTAEIDRFLAFCASTL